VNQLGFWECNGYHAYGDPFREQRSKSSTSTAIEILQA